MGDSARPVISSCRAIISAAGDVTSMLATAPPDYLERLQLVAPELLGVLTPLTDAVVDLDYRTAYLTAPGPATAGPLAPH